MSGEQDDPGLDGDDETLRRRLSTGAATSPAHDRAVLEAAARAGADIAAGRAGAAQPAARGRPTTARAARWLLPLAALLVLAVAVPWLIEGPGLVEETVRGTAAEVVPATGSVLSRPPRTIRGPRVPGGERYRLVVRDSAARELWRSEPQATPEFSMSEALRRVLPAEGTVLWTMSVATPTGSQERGPYWFRLEP